MTQLSATNSARPTPQPTPQPNPHSGAAASVAESSRPEPWHRTLGVRRTLPGLDFETVHRAGSAILSSYELGLAAAGPRLPAHERLGLSVEAAEERLDGLEAEFEAETDAARPFVCRIRAADMHAGGGPSPADLEVVAHEICEALEATGDVEDLDPFEMASALFDLGLHRPAVLFLERAVRRNGATVRACELMARCLLALDLPDLALLWALRPLRDEELEFETVFELVRLASVCQMRIASGPRREAAANSNPSETAI